jgi:phosphohistidine swiveling domain-containing protein
MASLSTVGSRLAADFATLDRAAFLARYGHLRPGTYDVQSPRYDESPDTYFDWAARDRRSAAVEPPFAISIDQLNRTRRLLEEHGLGGDAIGFFNFIQSAIEGREYAKFIFTQSLSDALKLLRETAASFGLSDEDCAYLDYSCVQQLYASSADPREVLVRSVESGRQAHAITRQLVLPPLIVTPGDVWAFDVPATDPNFVTDRTAEGPVAFADGGRDRLAGSIILIPSADPGYDWLFAHPIRGFITMWGGANSHMAVRAAELGIPAVIGAGEGLYNRWAKAEILAIDAGNRQVRVVR